MKHHIITISKLKFHKIHSFKRSLTNDFGFEKGHTKCWSRKYGYYYYKNLDCYWTFAALNIRIELSKKCSNYSMCLPIRITYSRLQTLCTLLSPNSKMWLSKFWVQIARQDTKYFLFKKCSKIFLQWNI